MSEIAIIAAPYHLGVEGVGVGAGPIRLLDAGLGSGARVLRVRLMADPDAVLDALDGVNRGIRFEVAAARKRGELPVVISGNCNSCWGTLAALEPHRTGIVWLDAHGDFHTPETSVSGFIDGMALAAAVGHWLVGLPYPVAEENVLLLGVRDLEEAEKTRLAASKVTCRAATELDDVHTLLDELATRVDGIYLHLDIDFLGPGGLSVAEGEALVNEIRTRLPLAAVALTNYNPSHDPEKRTLQAALRLLAAATGRREL